MLVEGPVEAMLSIKNKIFGWALFGNKVTAWDIF